MKKRTTTKRRVRAPRRRPTVELTRETFRCLRNFRTEVRMLNALLTDSSLDFDERVRRVKLTLFHVRRTADVLLSSFCIDYPTNGTQSGRDQTT